MIRIVAEGSCNSLIDGSLVLIIGKAVPPRDEDDEDFEDDEEEQHDDDAPVVREPDED